MLAASVTVLVTIAVTPAILQNETAAPNSQETTTTSARAQVRPSVISKMTLLLLFAIIATDSKAHAWLVGAPSPGILLPIGLDETVLPYLFTTNVTSPCRFISDPIVQHPWNLSLSVNHTWTFLLLTDVSKATKLCLSMLCFHNDTLGKLGMEVSIEGQAGPITADDLPSGVTMPPQARSLHSWPHPFLQPC